MKDLKALQKQIDKVNSEILDLINQRTVLLTDIIKIKNAMNIEYYDPLREAEMLKYIIDQNKGPLPNELVTDIFTSIFKSALSYMQINEDTKLIVSSAQKNEFKSIQEMLGLSANMPVIVAGPCAVENFEYLDTVAQALNKYGIKLIRGGAYKPRTSPYEFQGLKEEGLKILHEASRKHGLLSVTEVVDTRDVELITKYCDILQIGTRNMHNFELLKEVGQTRHPIILKRGMSATIKELIYAAEYIALQGNRNIILCERGIRTFETKTRNTLDISSIPIIKKETGLPIMVDLSHSLGRKDIIAPIAKAVLAAGADGIMVEVHPRPELALSDSKQQLNLQEFEELLNAIDIYV
jgi:3-deoxy-7-phosphoheptulonate synthase/chorismate mutase